MTTAWITDTLTLDLARAARYTLLWGLDGMILRTVGRGEQVPDVNEAKVRNRLAAAELPLLAIEPGLFESTTADVPQWMNDLVRLDESVAFCRRLDCSRIMVGSLAGGPVGEAMRPLRRATEAAAKKGVTLLVRNQGEGRERASDIQELLLAIDHMGIGAAWDPAASLAGGEDPSDSLARLGPHLGMIIVQDVQNRSSKVPWDDVFGTLAAQRFDGIVCIDLSGLSSSEALREATALIYIMRAARSAA